MERGCEGGFSFYSWVGLGLVGWEERKRGARGREGERERWGGEEGRMGWRYVRYLREEMCRERGGDGVDGKVCRFVVVEGSVCSFICI